MDKDEKISIKIVDIYDFQKQNNLQIRFTNKNGSLKTEWLTLKLLLEKRREAHLKSTQLSEAQSKNIN